MAGENLTKAQLKNMATGTLDSINVVDAATSKFRKGTKRRSIIKSAQGNIFEFPAFVMSDVPLDYATAVTALLEQVSLSYLQTAISINPVISRDMFINGRQFSAYKTDTNKYLEYADTAFMEEACHNELDDGEGFLYEFNMLSINDNEAIAINEHADYVPLSEFSHYFQEVTDTTNELSPSEITIKNVEEELTSCFVGNNRGDAVSALSEYMFGNDKQDVSRAIHVGSMFDKQQFEGLSEYWDKLPNVYKETIAVDVGKVRNWSAYEHAGHSLSSVDRDAIKLINQSLKSKFASAYAHTTILALEDAAKISDAELNNRKANAEIDNKTVDTANKNASTAKLTKELEILNAKAEHAVENAQYEADVLKAKAEEAKHKMKHYENNAQNEAEKLDAERVMLQWKSTDRWLAVDKDIHERQLAELQFKTSRGQQVAKTANDYLQVASKVVDIGSKIVSTVDNHELSKLRKELEKRKLRDYDEDRDVKLTKDRQDTLEKRRIKASSYIDDSKLQKLNTMKPLMMQVNMAVALDDGTFMPMEYVVGVKLHTRVIDADILPEVAQFPLKEMNKMSRRIKWRAGELKLLKDIVFNIKEKRQTAVDAKDPKRKWFRRLYTLAHMQGDAPASEVVVNQKSLLTLFIKDKQGKGKLQNGVMPNAFLICTKADVDNVKAKTDIDLLKGSTASKFCNELFLLGFVVIDIDAESIKLLLPDMNKEFDVHSLASVNKQLATLDTSGTKTRDMFKLLG